MVLSLTITMAAALVALVAFRLVVTAPTRHMVRRRDLVRPLSLPARDTYAREWWRIQAEFVDFPQVALADADALVVRVLDARGAVPPWQLESFRRVVGGSTEELRQGLLRYRRLFAELLEQPVEGRPNPN
jgi:hypothetical protein